MELALKMNGRKEKDRERDIETETETETDIRSLESVCVCVFFGLDIALATISYVSFGRLLSAQK